MIIDIEKVNVNVYYGYNFGNELLFGYQCENESTFKPTSHYVVTLENTGYNLNIYTKIILFN